MVVVLARMVGLGAALGRGSRVLLVGLGGVLVAGYAGLALFWYVDLRALLSVELDLPRGGTPHESHPSKEDRAPAQYP